MSVDVCQEKNTLKSYFILVCRGEYFQIKGGGRIAGMQIVVSTGLIGRDSSREEE